MKQYVIPFTAEDFSNKLYMLSSYVTPEMYGAVGDGVTDDSDALQAAIDSGKAVIGSGIYRTSKMLCVYTGNRIIQLNSIICNSTDSENNPFAITLNQESTVDASLQRLVFEVRLIESNVGGIRLYNAANKALDHVTLKVGSIKAFHHGISFDAYDNGIQYCNVYIDGVIQVADLKETYEVVENGVTETKTKTTYATGHCLNFYISETAGLSSKRWIGEIKFFGGHIQSHGLRVWALYANGYKQSEQSHITALRFHSVGFEQCSNGIYLKESECISFYGCRTEILHKNWAKGGGLVIEGYANQITFDGFAMKYDDIDISKITKNVGVPPRIEFGRVSRGNVPLGSAFVGADYRLKIKPYGRVHSGVFKDREAAADFSKADFNFGSETAPVKMLDYTVLMPRVMNVYATTHVEIDSSFDFFGDCKLIIQKFDKVPVGYNQDTTTPGKLNLKTEDSSDPIYIYYRLPMSEELVKIAEIKDSGFYELNNYFATLDANPYSLWRVTRLGDLRHYTEIPRHRADYVSTESLAFALEGGSTVTKEVFVAEHSAL